MEWENLPQWAIGKRYQLWAIHKATEKLQCVYATDCELEATRYRDRHGNSKHYSSHEKAVIVDVACYEDWPKEMKGVRSVLR